MEKKSVLVDYTQGMAFDATVQDHHVLMDAGSDVGGNDSAPTPKPLLLVSLAGCTGMDVVSLLSKMRQAYDSFQIYVEAEQTDEHPKYYHKIHLVYRFQGAELDSSKVQKAIDLSQDKYCGVSYMLRQASELTYSLEINGEKVD